MLKGKVVIVTGASRGIGRAISEKFAYEGVNLILTATSEDLLRQVLCSCCAVLAVVLPITTLAEGLYFGLSYGL